MEKINVGGYKVVLTSDRTLMSEYAGGIFLRVQRLYSEGPNT